MAVLLVNDYWKRNDKSRQTLNQINTNLAQKLYKRGVETYTTTLALTDQDDDLKHAKTKGVIIIQPKPTRKMKVPNIDWLGEYHARYFPDLPADVECIVGYSATTLEVASILKEEKYPNSKLIVINTIKPKQAEEDGQHFKDYCFFYNNVDEVFSFGRPTHARFQSLKLQENLSPDAKIYDDVEVISALCGGLKGDQRDLLESWEEIEMKEVADARFHSARPQTTQNPRKGNSASAATPTQTSRQQLLGDNYGTLVKNMGGKYILKYLVQDRIISIEKQREMKEEAGQRKQDQETARKSVDRVYFDDICDLPSLQKALNELILDEVAGGEDHAVQSLCAALRQEDVKQDFLADMLEPKTYKSGGSLSGVQVNWQPPYNVVLLGRTGSGKSATGNSIVGKTLFEESDMGGSQTQICDNAKARIDGYILNVIDTPGFADTNISHTKLIQEISRVHCLAHGGIHAVILVFRFPPRLTEEEKRAYDSLIQMFRDDILKHVIILYTYGDDFEKKAERHNYTLESYVLNDKNPKWFKELLGQVKKRYLIFDNYTEDPFKTESQRCKLLQMIFQVMAGTNNQPFVSKYTKIASQMMEQAQLALEEDKEHHAASAGTNTPAEKLPGELEANCQNASGKKSKAVFKLPKAARTTTKLSKSKRRRRGRGRQKKEERNADVPSEEVNVSGTGCDDHESRSQWTVYQSRSRRKSPRDVQTKVPSPGNATGKSAEQLVKSATTRVPGNDVVNAASGDLRNQTQSSQPAGEHPSNDPVADEAEIHRKFDELRDLVKQNKGAGKDIMQKLTVEIAQDARQDCFSASSVLVTDSIGKATEVPLRSVSIGDKVKVYAGTFEPVFLFSHAVEDVLSTFISIITEGGKSVSLSQSHLITVIKAGETVTVAAREVTKGNRVFSVEESSGCLIPDKVVNVHHVLKSGQYCPHTYRGSLIVDGVYVSCYTDKLPMRLAHGLLLPLRWIHRLCPSLFRLICSPERTNGVPWFMPKLDNMLTWWKSH